MTNDELAGFVITADVAEQFFLRVMEAEKRMGPLIRMERITILRSLASPLIFEELLDMMAGKRVLIVKDKNEETKES